MRAALSCLSDRYIQWHRLGVPDGDVASHEEFVEGALKTRLLPDTTLIAPFEHDGHPDREAVARLCISLARRKNIQVLRYPVWAWHRWAPADWRGLDFVRFELSAEAQLAKSRAIRCYASQLNDTASEPVVPAHMLTYFSRPYEAFVR